MRKLFFILIIVLSCSCTQKNKTKLIGFEVNKIPGTSSEWAIRYDDENRILEQGPVRDGIPTGTWTAYDPEKGTPTKLTTLVEGKRTGPSIEFGKMAEIKLYSEHYQDKLHGKRYEFGTAGRFTKEESYEHGVLNGPYNEWTNTGKLTKSMNYVDGKLHGLFTWYNKQGEKLMEYKYENGEKMSGGVVEKENVSSEK